MSPLIDPIFTASNFHNCKREQRLTSARDNRVNRGAGGKSLPVITACFPRASGSDGDGGGGGDDGDWNCSFSLKKFTIPLRVIVYVCRNLSCHFLVAILIEGGIVVRSSSSSLKRE